MTVWIYLDGSGIIRNFKNVRGCWYVVDGCDIVGWCVVVGWCVIG